MNKNNSNLYNNLIKGISRIIKKYILTENYINKSLINWTNNNQDNLEDSNNFPVHISKEDLDFDGFNFQWFIQYYPDNVDEGVGRQVSTFPDIYINMPNKEEAELLADTVINRIITLKDEKNLNKALYLLRTVLPQPAEWTGKEPMHDYPFVKNISNDGKDEKLKIYNDQFFEFITLVAFKDIKIIIWDENDKVMWRGNLIDGVLGDRSYDIFYFLGRYIQSIKKPRYSQEAYPEILIFEYVDSSWPDEILAWEFEDFEFSNDYDGFASFENASEHTKELLLLIIDELKID